MTKRIFRSIFLVAAVVLLAAFVLITGVLYDYFSSNQMEQLKIQTELAAQGVESGGMAYLQSLDVSGCRVTWIAADGEVLFDSVSDADRMENHAEREEVREALENGSGESMRYSSTLMERQLYSALRLDDGTVLRLSDTHYTPVTLILGTIQPVIIIAVLALGLSLYLASRLSKRIVRPLNEMRLDEPEEIDVYEELAPLTDKMRAQQRQLREQERELARRRDEFEAATGNMTEGLVLLNEQGDVLSINRAATRLLNISRYCIGKNILLLNSSTEVRELLEKVRTGEHAEAPLELDGGSYRLYASPVVSEERVSGAVLLVLDMTEKEKAEQFRREFSANVSHELKTPLHTISGCAELLANGIVKQEDIPRFLSQIQSESKRMIALIDDIIKLSHLDEGAGNMRYERTDLLQTARTAGETLRDAARQAGVSLSVTGESAFINGIPQLLGTIVYNLCENAIKYNREGGYVRCNIENLPHEAVLTVEDNGIGIPAEQQERIFERFYRVDKSHSKEVGGTGLGLSIVKHAAKLHNAKISVRSAVGEGTTISVAFPKEA